MHDIFKIRNNTQITKSLKINVTEGVGSIERGTEYVADFVIFNNDGTSRIVDTKGVKTNEFKLKMKSFREKYPTLKVELE